MPANLKKLVRERMAKTGESWVTALRNVRAQLAAEPAVAVPPPAPPPPPPQKTQKMRTPRLILATPEGARVIELGARNSLGRHPKSSIQLSDKIVANEHCILKQCDGVFVLHDLGSLNGTYVNGERLRGEQTLAHGDEIALGATRARYDDGSGPVDLPPPEVTPGFSMPLPPRLRPN
ncbi:MAG: FHA domain-containing protein [Polyangiaceae bacterium]|jgi:pSer/pThr/pTyr-binding forkhead associated (FHA) protein